MIWQKLIQQNLTAANKVEKVEVNTLKIQGNIANKQFNFGWIKIHMGMILFWRWILFVNSFGTTGHTSFKGVKLWSLLEQKQKISPNASSTLIATDGYSMEFTVDQVKLDYIDRNQSREKISHDSIAWGRKGNRIWCRRWTASL